LTLLILFTFGLNKFAVIASLNVENKKMKMTFARFD